MLYLDTSALAKQYVTEPESASIHPLLKANRGFVFTSIVAYAELLSLLARASREKRMTPTWYAVRKRAFLADWKQLHVVQVSQDLLGPAGRLIERHGLRGFDAIHLCSALWLGEPLFGCFDGRLSQAATAEGLSVVP
jgi:predicted nucleic acid-binding protein